MNIQPMTAPITTDTSGVEYAASSIRLYRLYDDLGVLLYVGISGNPQGRLLAHKATAPFRAFIANMEVDEWWEFPDYPTAERVEAERIRDEMPLFNGTQAGAEHWKLGRDYLCQRGADTSWIDLRLNRDYRRPGRLRTQRLPRSGPKTRAVTVADAIDVEIRDGMYPTGAEIPSRRNLAARYGVAIDTASAAVRVLENRGLVVSTPGAGTYVVDVLPGPFRTLEERIAALEAWVDAVERRLS